MRGIGINQGENDVRFCNPIDTKSGSSHRIFGMAMGLLVSLAFLMYPKKKNSVSQLTRLLVVSMTSPRPRVNFTDFGSCHN